MDKESLARIAKVKSLCHLAESIGKSRFRSIQENGTGQYNETYKIDMTNMQLPKGMSKAEADQAVIAFNEAWQEIIEGIVGHVESKIRAEFNIAPSLDKNADVHQPHRQIDLGDS